MKNAVRFPPCPSNVAFLGAGESLWDLTVAAGGAVAALKCVLGVGCGVEVEEKAHLRHYPSGGMDGLCLGTKAELGFE